MTLDLAAITQRADECLRLKAFPAHRAAIAERLAYDVLALGDEVERLRKIEAAARLVVDRSRFVFEQGSDIRGLRTALADAEA